MDLLRGDSALLDAAKKGNLSRVQKLLTKDNINCRDSQGRNSTPLHLAAGYNNLEVAEFLLENGADVNAQDKGGLIPLHNASSYGNFILSLSYGILTLLKRLQSEYNSAHLLKNWIFVSGHLDIAALLIRYKTVVNGNFSCFLPLPKRTFHDVRLWQNS